MSGLYIKYIIMKKIAFFLAIAMAIVATSCGGNGFDQDKADKIVKMMNDGEELTQEDYAEAIGLIEVGSDVSMEKVEELAGIEDKSEMLEKAKEIENDETLVDMAKSVQVMMVYIYQHRTDLDQDNAARLEKYEKGMAERAQNIGK